MTGVASLGMYDGTPLHAANDALWDAIAVRLVRRGLGGVPARLDRGRPLEAVWSDPDLLLGQCCGYPLVTRYRDRLRYVATPEYSAPGCIGASYRSRIIVRSDDPAERLGELRGRRAALNDRTSNSGMNLFRAALAPLAGGGEVFAEVVETGSHAGSMRAVADGRADVAAIDPISFDHVIRCDPALPGRLRTMAWTDATPGLPLVTSRATPDGTIDLLRSVLDEVTRSAETRPARDGLLIAGMACLPAGTYDRLLVLERDAARLGYPVLQ